MFLLALYAITFSAQKPPDCGLLNRKQLTAWMLAACGKMMLTMQNKTIKIAAVVNEDDGWICRVQSEHIPRWKLYCKTLKDISTDKETRKMHLNTALKHITDISFLNKQNI